MNRSKLTFLPEQCFLITIGIRKTARMSASQSFQLCALMRLLQVSNNVLFTAQVFPS